MNKWLKKTNICIIILWLVLTLININKAYHIDDTFHLEAAECISQHPLKPMSGEINWYDVPQPMYEFNQPPLLFYCIYLFQKIFGESEIALHLLISIFSFLSLLYFKKIADLMEIKSPWFILCIFGFSPTFIVNQNLMTDVPILAISLGSMYYLLKGLKQSSLKHYIISSALLSIGLLIKYSLLPIFVVIFISIIAADKFKKIIVLIIPMLILTLWSVWNFIEFNAIHFLSRPKSGFNIQNAGAFMGTLGSMATFTGVFIHKLIPKRFIRILIILFFTLFLISVPMVYMEIIKENQFNRFLNYIFIINGGLLIILLAIEPIKSFINQKWNYLKTPYFPLVLYISGIAAFIILFAPFNATRHILLLIPFILLFGHKAFEKSKGIINASTLSVTIVLGILLGVSDRVYADFYRKNAAKIELANHKTWTLGHWGWQWYSKKAGMLPYSNNQAIEIQTGDLVVYPKDISKQAFHQDIELKEIDYITEDANFLTFFSGKNFASMYNSFVKKPAWSLSKTPIDTIFIYEVSKEIGVESIVESIKSDEQWLNDVSRKAIERNIPLDSMLILDAKWLLNEKRKKQ